MDNIRFEWDEAKDRSNRCKHGVSFEAARRVFEDPMRVLVFDRAVGEEERWQTVCIVKGIVLLLVIHTTAIEVDGTQSIEVIPIISARKTTPMEREI